MDDMVPMNRLVNRAGEPRTIRVRARTAPQFWRSAAATIQFVGGSMASALPSPLSFTLPTTINPETIPARHIPLITIWRPTTTAGVVIEVTDETDHRSEPVSLSATETAFIYNWDRANVKLLKLLDVVPCKPGPKCDDDFKWLYSLLIPPAGNWKAVVGEGNTLPAPETVCPREARVSGDAHNIDTGMCFGGGWCCDPAQEEC
jgi:hypothetical protein